MVTIAETEKRAIAPAEALHCIGQLVRYQSWGTAPRVQLATFCLRRVDGLAQSPSSFVRHGCMLARCGCSPRG